MSGAGIHRTAQKGHEKENPIVIDARKWVLCTGQKLQGPVAKVAAEMASRRIEAISTGWYHPAKRDFDHETEQGSPYEFYAMACHDVGRVIHRNALEGQIQGGIVQSMRWGVSEALLLKDGVLQNPNFTDYIIPTSADAPAIKIDILESDGPGGPFGTKEVEEPSFIPTAAAIRNGVCDALGIDVDTLPLTPPTVVAALGDRHPFSWVLEGKR